MSKTAADHVQDILVARLDYHGWQWYEAAAREVRGGVSNERFCALLSLASRQASPQALRVSRCELDRAAELLLGWSPERWTLLETLRVALVMARSDLDHESAVEAIDEAFRYADAGELCALYRAFPLLPDGERFVWQAGEGCRTNMVSVFESIACDSPYPAVRFDDVAFQQLVMKAIFIGTPLWRVYGLDERLTPELARMALDLADERRSASREVQPDLWLCLGEHAGERGILSLEQEIRSGHPLGRRAAVLALARAGRSDRLGEIAGSSDAELGALATAVCTELSEAGRPGSGAFPEFVGEVA